MKMSIPSVSKSFLQFLTVTWSFIIRAMRFSSYLFLKYINKDAVLMPADVRVLPVHNRQSNINFFFMKQELQLIKNTERSDAMHDSTFSSKLLFMKKMIQKPAVFIITLLMMNLLFVNNVFSQSLTYSTPGTYTFTVPNGVTSITVSAWGAGGAGGGVTGGNPRAGGGGEGGSFVRGTLTVTPGTLYTVVVGSNGVGSTGNGTAGGPSSFGGSAVINAIGGAGGNAGITGSTFGAGGNTANTGNIATGTSTVSFYGGFGGTATNASTASSGGGGGSAGAGSNGGNGGVLTGGTAGTSGGVVGATGRGSTNDGVGLVGGNPGAGGSGARNANNSTTYIGGDGGDGQVQVTWTCASAPNITNFSTAASTPCAGSSSTVTVTSTSIVSTGNYNVYYYLTGANVTAAAQLATLNFNTTSNTGTFSTIALANAGATTITIGSIECAEVTSGNTASVTVNPIPSVTNSPLTQTVCSGTASTLVTLTSGVAGTTFAWTASATTGVTGFTASGTSTIAAQTISTSQTTQGTVTYAITPTAAGCVGPVANYTTLVNPKPAVSNTPLSETICSGGTSSLVTLTSGVGGTTFAWTASATTGVAGFTGSGTSTIPAQTISTSQTTQGTVTYAITPTAAGCAGNVTNYTVLVNPKPAVSNSPLTQTICTGANSTLVTLTSGVAGTTFAWTASATTGVTGFTASGTSTIPVQTISTSQLTQGTVTYTITPTANGCAGNATNYTILVNPRPTVTNSPLTQTICSGSASSLVTLTANIASTFAWTASATTGVTGFTGSGTSTIGAQTISTSQTTQGTVTYAITPTAAGCAGTVANYTVLVNPAPTVTNSPLTQTICSGASSSLVTLTSGVAGTSFAWTASATTGVTGFVASGTSTIGAQTISTNQTTQGTVTYVISSTAPVTGCTATTNYTILVNPVPSVTNASLTQTICSGSNSTLVTLTTGVSGTSYSWSATATTGVTGFTASGTTTSIPVQTISTNQLTQGTVTYAITPTAAGCTGPVTNYTILVNPKPAVSNTPLSETICSGGTSSLVTLTSNIPSTFAWTASATTGVTGFTASGTSTIPAQTISTTQTTQGTVTYAVTPTAAGCAGTVTNYTVLVNPKPAVTNSPLTQTICTGSNSTLVTLTSGVAGTTFAWTASATTGVTGFTASGTSTIPVQTISTSQLTQGTVTYTITPTANGCAGNPTNYTILVNPRPTVTNSPLTQTICSGGTSTLVTLTANISSTFAWTASATTGVTGFTASGTSTIPTQTISTSQTTQGTVTYAITPTANSCAGTVANYAVLVNPRPAVTNSPLTQTICSGESNALVTLTSGVAGTSFAWTASATTGITGFAASGTSTIGAQTISTSQTTQGTVTYAITPTANGCPGTVANYTVLVNPLPNATGITICQNGSGSLTSSASCPNNAPVTDGPDLAGTGSINGSGTTWTNPGRVVADDNSYATSTGTFTNGTTSSVSLNSTNFGFNIPANATINGIEVTIGRFRNGGFVGEVLDNSIRLMKVSPTVVGNNNSAGATWGTSETAVVYGTASDLWGTTWTPAQINASTFGVALIVNFSSFSNRVANVDYTKVTITYTVPGSLNWYTVSSGGTSIGSGSPFNPVGVLNSGLANTATAGTTTFYAECSTVAGCRTPVDFEITPSTTIDIEPTAPAAVCSGTGVQTLNVAASGTGTITYSWRKAGIPVSNDAVISGQGTATLTLTNPTTANAGNYDVLVSSDCGSATSGAVPVNINTAPSITIQPVAPAVTCTGSGTQTISVTATGTGLSYSWRQGGVPVSNGGVVSGQGTNTLTLTNPTAANAGSYDVVVSGTCSPDDISTAVTVTVNPATIITVDAAPSSQTVYINDPSPNNLTVTATGTGLLTYQWFSNTSNSNVGGTSVGAGNGGQTNTYTPPTNTLGLKYYYAEVTGTCGTATSSPVAVTITNTNTWKQSNPTNDWNTASNWAGGSVPTGANDAAIPVGNTPYPVLSTSSSINNLIIDPGATVGIGSNTLTVNGTITGTGTLSGSATSNLVTNTTTTARFTTGANILKNLTVNAGTTTLANPVNITAGTALNTYGTVTVVSGATLASNGNLNIKSNEFGTARVAAGDVTGNYITGDVTVERYIPQNASKAWRLLSVPTKGTKTIKQTWQENQAPGANGLPGFGTQITANLATLPIIQAAGFDAFSQSGSAMSYNSGTQAWNYLTSTNSAPIETNKGYFLYIRGSRAVSPSNSTAPVDATVLRTTGTLYQGDNNAAISIAASKFEPIGNTFASAIDFTGLNKTGTLTNSFYVWDSKLIVGGQLGAYQTFVGALGFTPATNGGSYPAGIPNTTIESGEAIMVGAPTGGGGTVKLVEASKTTGNGQFNPFRPASLPAQFRTNLVRINGATNTVADNNIGVFDQAFSNAVDGDDATRFPHAGENLSILRDGQELIVEARQPVISNDTLFFMMRSMQPQQQYKFEFSSSNLPLAGLAAYVEDKFLNTVTPINLASAVHTHNFTVDATAASAAADRFRIVFKQTGFGPVPVNFISVGASKGNSGISVTWTVAGERSIRNYEVERSADGRSFSAAGTVAANGRLSYNWLDASATGNITYYRIKSVGTAGDIKYSTVVKVTVGNVKPAITISPNPVEGSVVNLQFKNQPKGNYHIRLMSNAGQVVFTSYAEHAGGTSTQILNLPTEVARGTYQLEIIAPDKTRQVQTLFINSTK